MTKSLKINVETGEPSEESLCFSIQLFIGMQEEKLGGAAKNLPNPCEIPPPPISLSCVFPKILVQGGGGDRSIH